MTVVRRIASPVVRPLVRAINAAYGISAFTPARLFTAGVNGAWYDPSDITTLYRDAAGTLPVTAVEQPVGLMLDKSKGLVLGPELVTNGGFDTDTAWTKGTGWTISGGRATRTNVAAISGLSQTVVATQGKFYQITIEVVVTGGSIVGIRLGTTSQITTTITASGTYTYRVACDGTNNTLSIVAQTNFSGTVDNISVRELPGNHAFNSSGNSANFPVLSARYNQYLSTETLATQNVTTVAASYKLAFTGTGSITLSGTATGTYSAGTHTITCTAGTLTSTVSGTVTQADLRVANDALNQPAYQRVNTATDYDTVGFKPYLKFNGTNQWLQTNSIDFTYGDKMFVSAGVRKLSDALIGMLIETSDVANSNDGAFAVAAPGWSPVAGQYGSLIRASVGSVYANSPASFAAPITSVLSESVNFAGSTNAQKMGLRVNGADQSLSFFDTTSTGNFGNYPLYIGARAGSNYWFNGRLYQMVVAGKQASAAEITSTETYINQKTGAF